MAKKTKITLKKESQLGMGLGKANEILRKSILYSLVTHLNKSDCSHCNDSMSLNNFSIEHIIPWLHSTSPKELFFDLNNITFNHLKCNIKKARKNTNADNGSKKEQLGMPFGTANYQLKRNLIFNYLNQLHKNECFVCKKQMTLENYSIEHKIPWLDSKNPKELFFDLDNISFSHKKCNFKSARKTHEIVWEEGKAWCWSCTTMKLLEDFPPSKINHRTRSCRVCATIDRKRYARNRNKAK